MIPGIVAGYPVSSGPPPVGWNAAVNGLPNLWGWWKLDETAGTSVSALDSSGNGRHGTYTATGSQTDGLFDGSTIAQATLGGRVNLPSFPLPATPIFTIGAFIVANSTAAVQSILSADGSDGRAWQFTKTAAHKLNLTIIQPSVVATTGATSINDDSPHLVVLVFDQSLAAAAGRVKIYLDGSLEVASTTAITTPLRSATNPAIGARNNEANQELWGGAIDECFMCDGALSSTDVADLWAARNDS